jgi:hypothetical protein
VKALLCIGKLIKLELIKPNRKMSLRNKWLAWDGRNLHVCTVHGVMKSRLPSALLAKHRKFHNADPKGEPFKGDCPTRQGGIKALGLVKALVYTVPRKIRSPEKNPYRWRHKFGDTGHEGGSYPEKVMPALEVDQAGNLFFKRRPGNIYKVDQWIQG